MVILKRRSWALRVGLFFGGILAVAAVFLLVVRVLNVTVAGVEPEALVLTGMMTAPFTVGFVLLFMLGSGGGRAVGPPGPGRGSVARISACIWR